MPDQTANLALPLLASSQAQKHVTHNEALNQLDALVQISVLDRHLTAPPGGAAEGDRYIPAGPATGAWVGQENAIAVSRDGGLGVLRPAQRLACLGGRRGHVDRLGRRRLDRRGWGRTPR
jgi:hypothetical protein